MGLKLKKEKQQFFQFKQFKVWQNNTAMKVCTDACIFGAFIETYKAQNILDIGTGTGLLALMLAQKTDSQIFAVEIEQNAFIQAKENFEQSLWKKQLQVFHTSIQDFVEETQEKFDLIVSNPPFFKKHLQTQNIRKNLALHNESLPFEELIKAVSILLNNWGKFYLLLPDYETQVFVELASKENLFLQKQILIFHSIEKKILRVMSVFSKTPVKNLSSENFYIKNLDQTYTQEFIKLLSEYYIIF